MDIESIARVCHEANKGYCDSIGDYSQKSWIDAADWQLDSAIKGVSAALAGQSAEELHASWCNDKLAGGWKHGDVKDAEAKTHPCLVPYHELPVEQQKKDALFRAVVDALKD